MRAPSWILFSVICLMSPLMEAQANKILIGPGDLLHIQVFDTPEMEQHLRVSEAGDVPLEFLGDVHVAGMSASDVAHDIQQRLIAAKLLLNPQVAVFVDQYATQNVSVLGEVHAPGTYQINAPRSIIDVLAMAGGLTPTADRHIMVKRHNSTDEKLTYFLSNNADTAFDSTILIYPGDTLLVEKAGIVYILGDVKNPGGYTMDDNRSQLTALQAIAQAGGLNKTAVAERARLIRKNPDGSFSESRLGIARMQKGKEADMPLGPGDIVYVPFSYVKGIGLGAAGITASVASAAMYTH